MSDLPAAHLPAHDELPQMTGAKVFVSLVFLALAAIFVASTAVLINEFRDHDWKSLLLLHSHLFVFFPTLGVLVLVAFHLPATVFTHMYWQQIRFGKVRFLLGALMVVGATAWFSYSLLTTGARQAWEIAPNTLQRAVGEPVGCGAGGVACKRVALLDGISNLRAAAQSRIGVSKFARVCRPDPLMEPSPEWAAERFCFAADGKFNAETCCAAQARYGSEIDRLWANPAHRSLSSAFDLIALPAKAFFVIVVIVIGGLLVVWRRLLEQRYAALAPAIERHLLIGAVAMLPWPFMDYAHLQAMQTLSGRWSPSLQPRLSLVIAPWALLLLVFFLSRMGRKVERLGQLAGAVASLVALLRYEQMNDAAVRFLGVGAPLWMIAVLVLVCALSLVTLRWPKHLQRAINGVFGRPPDIGTEPPPPFFKRRKKARQTTAVDV